jgi:hypothetical protein
MQLYHDNTSLRYTVKVSGATPLDILKPHIISEFVHIEF